MSSANAPLASSSSLHAAPSSASIEASSAALFASLLRAPRARVPASSAAGCGADEAASAAHFTSRVLGRRLQLSNPERARPAAPSGTLAARKLQRRDVRVAREERRVREGKADKGKEEVGAKTRLDEERKEKGRKEKGVLSRRERKMLGLEPSSERCS